MGSLTQVGDAKLTLPSGKGGPSFKELVMGLLIAAEPSLGTTVGFARVEPRIKLSICPPWFG